MCFGLFCYIHRQGFKQWLCNVHALFYQLIKRGIINGLAKMGDLIRRLFKKHIHAYFKIVARKFFLGIQPVKRVEFELMERYFKHEIRYKL